MTPDDRIERARVGLCFDCKLTKRIVSGKGSTFYLCTEPTLPKYPPLPVRACLRYDAASPEKEDT